MWRSGRPGAKLPSERQMWDALRKEMKRLALDPVRIENRVGKGVPDVNFTLGWVELKHRDKWPVRNGPVDIGVSPEQKVWLLRRWNYAPNTAWLCARVGREWLMFAGYKPIEWGRPLRADIVAAADATFDHPRGVAGFLGGLYETD